MYKRLCNTTAFPENLLPICLLCFSIGVISIRFVPWIPPRFYVAGVALIAMAVFCRVRLFQFQLVSVFLIGLCWAGWHAAGFQSATIPLNLEKKDLQVTGVISSPVRQQGRGSNFDFNVLQLQANQFALPNPGVIRLSSYERGPGFHSGEHWEFTVRLKRPRSLINPGMGFDYAAWLMSKGITAKGYIVKGSARRVASATPQLALLSGAIDQIRQEFSDFLGERLTGSSERAVFGALSVGIRDQMDDDTWQVLRDTGTAHLVAISGLHIGLVALIAGLLGGVIWGASGSFRQWVSKPVVSWCFALFAALLYALLAGFPLPTQRAVSMLVVTSIFVFIRRVAPTAWLLTIVLAVVLLLNPLAPLASSFWLSFIAVVVLIFGLRKSSGHKVAVRSGVAHFFYISANVLRKWTKMQLWLFFGMMPALLAGFHQISLVSPLANLVAVPVIGMIIVPLVLFAVVAWRVGALELAALTIDLASRLFQFIWTFLSWLTSMPFATWKLGAPGHAPLLIACIGFLLLILGRGLPWRWLGALWFLPLFTGSALSLARGEFRYTMLDVGQGLASVVETQSHTMVFDVGASYPGGFDLGEAVVVPFLRSRKISEIDLMLISHGDNDHAGGAKAVSNALDIHQLYASDMNPDLLPGSAVACSAGQKWHWDDVMFEILWPPDVAGALGNNASCVVKVSSKYGSLLLTGDIERSAEEHLVKQYSRTLSADVLQVPHHGSKTSSTRAFIRSVKPALALFSNGYLNRFGHPHPVIKTRYIQTNIPVMSTAEQGAIEVEFSLSGIQIVGERFREPRFWRDKVNLPGQFSLSKRIDKSQSDILFSG